MSGRGGFRLLWSSTAASNLADGMALVLLPLVALDGGADAAGVALITVALTLAWPTIGLHAGWIVDRFPKRIILAAGNAARGLAFAALAVAVLAGPVPLWAVLVTAALYGVGETLVDTAINASVPRLVEPAGRTRAIARIEAAIEVTNGLAGRPLAGILVGLSFGIALGSVFLLYATAAVLAVAIVALGARAVAETAATPDAVRLRDGIATLWRHPVLRNFTILTSVANLVWAMFDALFIVYAVAPGPLGLSPAEFGLVLSLGALGGILSSLVLPLLLRRIPPTVLLAVDIVGTAMLAVPIAIGAPLGVIAGGIVLAAAGSIAWRIIAASYRQQELPEHLLGRAYSASRVISWGSLPVGAGIATVVAAVAGVTAVFQVASGISAVLIVLFAVMLVPPRRRVRLHGSPTA